MAFHLLGLSTQNLLTEFQLQDFGKMVNLPISGNSMRKAADPTMRVRTGKALKGDVLLHHINVASLCDVSIRQYMIDNDVHDFSIAEVEDVASRYRDFKILNSIYDYTDMLLMAKTGDLNLPHWKYLFIDEAQDLSTLLWTLVNRMAANTDHIIIAGDDKQAINEFAGADVATFLSVPGKVEVLEQSYRTPRVVYNLANKLMTKMRQYRPEGSNWKPRAEAGFIKRCGNNLPILQMLTGEWLVLARASYQLEHVREQIIRMSDDGALLFTLNGGSPVDTDVFRLISLFKAAQLQGTDILKDMVTIKDSFTVEERKTRLEYISLFKKYISCDTDKALQPWEVTPDFLKKLDFPWAQAMDKVPQYQLRYIQKIYPLYLEKGDNLFADAKVRLMTIHAAKGREADNVLLVTDLPRQVLDTIRYGDTDVEIKTLYVAITRAKKNLYLYSKTPSKFSYMSYL